MGSVSTPPDRNYAQETRDTLKAQVDLAPDRYAAEAKFQPQYADLANRNMQTGLTGKADGTGTPGFLNYYRDTAQPIVNEIAGYANTASRKSDVNDLETLGGRAVAAIKGANPEQQAVLGRLTSDAMGAGEDSLVATMRRQAQDELDRGATLDPSLARQVQQSARSGQAARGFGFGMPDMAQEALFTGQAAEQLRGTRRAFAGNVAQLTAQGAQQRTGNLMGAYQAQAAGAVDPMLAILGRPSMAYNANAFQNGAGAGGPSLFNPESAYAGQINSQNYSTRADAMKASAANQTALIGAGIGAAGSAAGSM